MNTEITIFKKLLPANIMFELYKCIDNSLCTDIDIYNSDFDFLSAKNSLSLMIGTDILYINENGYYKHKVNYNLNEFKNNLLKKILNCYSELINDVFNINYHYDENKNKAYFFRNSIDLNYAGLLMILIDLDYLITDNERKIYFNDLNQIKKIKNIKESKKLSIEQLKNKIELQNVLGREAEEKAKIFEDELLMKSKIKYQCNIISDVDVAAGYDIVSHLTNSEKFDKYIEVKSCSNDFEFYFSRNELEISKIKKNSYFLYLYNRDSDSFLIIQNPYERIFINKEWCFEASSYFVRRI